MSIHVEIGGGPFFSADKGISGEGKIPTQSEAMNDLGNRYNPNFLVLPEADFRAIIFQVAEEIRRERADQQRSRGEAG